MDGFRFQNESHDNLIDQRKTAEQQKSVARERINKWRPISWFETRG